MWRWFFGPQKHNIKQAKTLWLLFISVYRRQWWVRITLIVLALQVLNLQSLHSSLFPVSESLCVPAECDTSFFLWSLTAAGMLLYCHLQSWVFLHILFIFISSSLLLLSSLSLIFPQAAASWTVICQLHALWKNLTATSDLHPIQCRLHKLRTAREKRLEKKQQKTDRSSMITSEAEED